MKKFIVSVIIIGAFIIYSIISGHSDSAALLPASSLDSGSSPRPSTGSTVIPATPGATGPSNTSYKDGSFTGSIADAQWGYIQVKAVIQSGKITNVQFLQYPNERNRSIEINNYADPLLSNEAIQAQNANVDIITGATDSSEAFIQSLSDALSRAKA